MTPTVPTSRDRSSARDASAIPDLLEIARLVSFRQAAGIATVSDEVEFIRGSDATHGVMCFAGPGSWANQAINLGLREPVLDEDFERIIAFYESRGVEPKVEVCPYADESLIRGLGERGFRIRTVETNLVFDTERTMISELAHDVEIVRVDPNDEAMVEESVRIRREGFAPPESPEAHDRMMHRVLRAPGVVGFMAKVDGAFVAAGDVEAVAPAAVLIAGCTLEAARGRGCQRALMIARLRAAREAGCRYVMVETLPHVATGRNALRLGFFVAYTKMTFTRPGEGLLASP